MTSSASSSRIPTDQHHHAIKTQEDDDLPALVAEIDLKRNMGLD
jgi:hypothetical protein